MGQKVCSTDQPLFATCVYGCPVVEYDVYALSRHYKKPPHNLKVEYYPKTRTFISDQQAKLLLNDDKKFNKKVAGREAMRAKERVDATTAPALNTNTSTTGQSTSIQQQNIAHIAGSSAGMAQAQQDGDDVVDTTASDQVGIINDLNDDLDPTNEDAMDVGEDYQALSDEQYSDHDSQSTYSGRPRLSATGMTAQHADSNTYYDGHVSDEYSDEEDSLTHYSYPCLLRMPAEICTEIIPHSLVDQSGPLYGLGDMELRDFDASLLQVSRSLRGQTLNFFAKQEPVIKLVVRYTTLKLLYKFEDEFAKLPFLRLRTDLDTDKSMPVPVTSVHLTMDLAQNPEDYVKNRRYAMKTTCAFIFEYQSFQSLLLLTQKFASQGILQKLSIVFSKRDFTEQQRTPVKSLTGLLGILHGIRKVELSGLLSSAFPAGAHVALHIGMGSTIFNFQMWLEYIYRLFDHALDLSIKTPEDAYHALRHIRSCIARTSRIYTIVSGERGKRLLKHAHDCCNLNMAKVMLSLCARADAEGKLGLLPQEVVENTKPRHSLGPRHTQAFRADRYLIKAISRLFCEKWWRAKATVHHPHRPYPRSRRQIFDTAARELWLANALGHPASDDFTPLMETCRSMSYCDLTPPWEPRHFLPYPDSELSHGFGCYTKAPDNLSDNDQPALLWQQAVSTLDHINDHRVPVWWGYREHLLNALELGEIEELVQPVEDVESIDARLEDPGVMKRISTRVIQLPVALPVGIERLREHWQMPAMLEAELNLVYLNASSDEEEFDEDETMDLTADPALADRRDVEEDQETIIEYSDED